MAEDYIYILMSKQPTLVSIKSFKELNLKFDAVIAEFKKEKEALIDINSKLHTRIEELEHEKKRIDARIWDLVTEVSELEITTRDLDDQYEENNARIVKLEQTQKSMIQFFDSGPKNKEFDARLITEFEIKKQAKCIQISKELPNEDPIVVYCPPFLNGLKLDASGRRYTTLN
nr:8691_t:CDS:2 [Entrophospora candida]